MKERILKEIKKTVSLVMVCALVVMGIQLDVKETKAASATSKLPVSCYTLSGSVKTYTNSACTNYSGYIDSTDLCKITAFYTDYASIKVQYPVRKGTKTAYAKASGFFNNVNFNTSSGKTGKKLTAYIHSTGADKMGTVYASDECIVTGNANGRTQLIYPAAGGYKLGWVEGSYDFSRNNAINSLNSLQGINICFNSTYYANSYADLKIAFGYDYNKLLTHWQTYGIKEGRSASPVFDPVYYMNSNGDLVTAFGSKNYMAAYNHFLQYGCSEGRASSKYYNGAYYKNKYGDLCNMCYYDLAVHYLSYGINEKRLANSMGYIPSGVFVPDKNNNNNTDLPSAFLYPMKGKITISSNAKTNGFNCDYKASSGTPVYAPADGKVVFRQTYSTSYKKLASYGNNIVFTSGDGVYEVKCAHLSSFNGISCKYTSSLAYPCGASKYKCNTIICGTKNVKQGDLIGYTGSTGNASGPHLHIEVRKNGNAANPASVFTTWN